VCACACVRTCVHVFVCMHVVFVCVHVHTHMGISTEKIVYYLQII